MECERDKFSGTFGEAKETQRKRVSHALNVHSNISKLLTR